MKGGAQVKNLTVEDVEDSDNWLNIAHVHKEELMNLSWEIESVARSFGDLGNTVMESRLWEWAKTVSMAQDAIDRMTSLVSSEMLRHSQEATGNMVMAALAVGQHYTKDDEAGKEESTSVQLNVPKK